MHAGGRPQLTAPLRPEPDPSFGPGRGHTSLSLGAKPSGPALNLTCLSAGGKLGPDQWHISSDYLPGLLVPRTLGLGSKERYPRPAAPGWVVGRLEAAAGPPGPLSWACAAPRCSGPGEQCWFQTLRGTEGLGVFSPGRSLLGRGLVASGHWAGRLEARNCPGPLMGPAGCGEGAVSSPAPLLVGLWEEVGLGVMSGHLDPRASAWTALVNSDPHVY